ncbi:hypothetical protein F66182_12416 [Fusarium sp. NRRL 66182]|nr:hypothetical protein F66182_12416 [Fusarium sp. NRRL 66182]
MSFVNLLGNLVTPRYSTLYLVRSEMMDEASRRGGEFQGVVGNLESVHLEVEDAFVFSAALKESAQERWEFQLGEDIYLPGEVEPMTTGKHELASNPDEERIEIDPVASHAVKLTFSADENELKPTAQSSDTRETDEKRKQKKKKSKEDKKPFLLCPNCYYFKTTKASRDNFLSIANPKQFHYVGEWLIRLHGGSASMDDELASRRDGSTISAFFVLHCGAGFYSILSKDKKRDEKGSRCSS